MEKEAEEEKKAEEEKEAEAEKEEEEEMGAKKNKIGGGGVE